MIGFSDKQLEIFKFGYSDYDVLIATGAVRSGKTAAISLAFVLWAMSNFENKNFIISSKTVTSAERNIIKPLMDIVYLHDHFDLDYKTSKRVLTLTRGTNQNRFYLYGAKDEASYANLQGLTAAGLFADEAVLQPESFINQAIARCSEPNSKIWFSLNPDSPDSWFYQNWIMKSDEKKALNLQFTMHDNPSLDPEIIARYERLYDGVFYDRYILGRWVRAEGLIYTKLANNRERYMIDEIPKNMIMTSVGVDFGGNKSSTAFVGVGFTPHFEQVIVLESERIDSSNLSPKDLDDKFAMFCDVMWNKYNRVFTTRADSAEQVLIRGLKNTIATKRLKTQIKNSLKLQIKDRIELVQRLLSMDRIKFLRNTTDSIVDALSKAAWNDKRENQRLDDFTTPMDDIDAFEYALEEYMTQLMSYDLNNIRKETNINEHTRNATRFGWH